MEGSSFIWMCWLLWVWSTFFLEKSNKRFYLATISLLLIALIPVEIELFSVKLNMAIIFIFILLCYLMRTIRLLKLLYMLGISICIAMACISFQLFSLYDPVVLFIDIRYYLSAFSILLAAFVFGRFSHKLSTCIMGIVIGEFFWGITSYTFFSVGQIGRLFIFDVVFYSALFLLSLYGFKQCALFINRILTLWLKSRHWIEEERFSNTQSAKSTIKGQVAKG
ncbi:hypothetical protein [Alkalihalobacillus trypoxylicola]|uniref:Uncharacterized protein n=1 Tax=Alkalihalobacillus trypoxylicola TaxID=519424 RepID=A0A162EKB7_9BACI|nr:hypothetical protein [Alkalihalobacillus trypoxylicola]KYG33118.1 hypothetical protein AZF04_17375 [Alkalihalobacillus trypoxylicola]